MSFAAYKKNKQRRRRDQDSWNVSTKIRNKKDKRKTSAQTARNAKVNCTIYRLEFMSSSHAFG